jgi:hypothetical protein
MEVIQQFGHSHVICFLIKNIMKNLVWIFLFEKLTGFFSHLVCKEVREGVQDCMLT